MRHFRLIAVCIALAVCVSLAVVPAAAGDASGSALILYDSTGPWAWLGEIYAKQLANILGHFQLAHEIAPVEGYTSGAIDSHLATFYIGSIYDNSLPRAVYCQCKDSLGSLSMIRADTIIFERR